MRIQDLVEEARQKALSPRSPTRCRVCRCEIPVEKRQGRPRLTCETCALFRIAAAHPLPRYCEHCRTEFWPERDAARFCSDGCRRQSDKERRRLVYTAQRCARCEQTIDGRARKFCSPDCRQQLKNILRRKSAVSSIQACPDCEKVFTSWRAGVTYCSKPCAKRRADRNYSARHRRAASESLRKAVGSTAQEYDA